MPTVPFSLRLDAEVNRKKAIHEAVKEADNGVFLSHDSVVAWMESLGTENEQPHPKPDVFTK